METCTKTKKRRGERSSEAGLMMKRGNPRSTWESGGMTSAGNTCCDISGP